MPFTFSITTYLGDIFYKNIKTVVNGVEIGYIADYKILNSVNFSVAQNRERLIYIAIREEGILSPILIKFKYLFFSFSK